MMTELELLQQIADNIQVVGYVVCGMLGLIAGLLMFK